MRKDFTGNELGETMTIETIMQKLKLELDAVRYQHSVNVMETSELLARHYGADLNKARLAGILHDCGKNYKGLPAIAAINE